MKRFVEVKVDYIEGLPTKDEYVDMGKKFSLSDLISQVPDIKSKLVEEIKKYTVGTDCLYDKLIGGLADSILQLFKEV